MICQISCRFKRAVTKAGTAKKHAKREFYEKPSVKRKRKSEAARKRKNSSEYETDSGLFCFLIHQRQKTDLLTRIRIFYLIICLQASRGFQQQLFLVEQQQLLQQLLLFYQGLSFLSAFTTKKEQYR